MTDQPRHVSSGGFRVNRARMLAKLREFQTPDPTHFVLSWIRSAVASGATWIKASDLPDGACLDLRFDGLPFRAAELEEPFQSLFEAATPGTRRNRYLAFGLLTAFGLKPKSLTLITGRGTQRLRLELRDLEHHSLSPVAEDDDETVLRATWTSPPRALKSLPELVATRCVGCPAPIDWHAAGRNLLIPAEREGEMSHREGGARARVWRLGRGDTSELSLSVDGVAATIEHVPLPLAQVAAYWDDPELKLDASHAHVVRNARYRRAREWLFEAAEALIKQEARRHEETAEWLSHRLEGPEALRAWRAALDGPEIPFEEWRARERGSPTSVFSGWLGKPGPRRPSASTIKQVWESALRARWLRRAGAAMVGRPGLWEVWRTPLFFDAAGRPLTLSDVQHFLGRDYVAVYFDERRAPSDWPAAKRGLWLSSVDDRTTLLRIWPRLRLLPG